MVKSKPGSSKKPKRGVDFKKYKRKIGRKLPPPKNHTNTQIKSKAIVLLEQSVASERAGLAVNKKGLTLRELLQQTSHHNAKIRRAALIGIKDIILKHKSELKLHKLVVIEKLRERICDSDRNVRETLYQLLEYEIFPFLKEDTPGAIISLLMAYIFNAMTHMAVDIRLMAFKFFNLVVQSFPSSFILYGEKVLDSYIDILRNNQIYLQDRSKLKNVLDGLVRCISSLASKEGESNPSNEPRIGERRSLHAFETVMYKVDSGIIAVVKKLDDLIPILVNCFRDSTSLICAGPGFDAQSFGCMLKIVRCIHLAVKVFVNESQVYAASSGLHHTPLLLVHNGRSTMFANLSKLWESFPMGSMHSSTGKEDERFFTLNVRILEIFLHLTDWIDDGFMPIEKFLEFIESLFGSLLPSQVGSHFPSREVLLEKHFGPIVLFIPRLVSQIRGEWQYRLLEAFTGAFRHYKVDSKLFLAYLSAVEEMLLPVKSECVLSITSGSPDILGYQLAWIQHLPNMLLQLGDKHPSISKVVLNLILRIGQCSQQNSPIALEYDNLQLSLKRFYGGSGSKEERMEVAKEEERGDKMEEDGNNSEGQTIHLPNSIDAAKGHTGFEERMVEEVEEKEDKKKDDKGHDNEGQTIHTTYSVDITKEQSGSIQYGSFIKLPRDCQELAVCSLYYVSNLSSDFLQTLAGCCLCNNMEPVTLLRIIDVLHSAYKAGHLHISDHIGFLVTLVAHKVFSEKSCVIQSDGKVSCQGTFRSFSASVCSCLSQLGDSTLVLKLLCKSIFNEMSKKLPIDNMHGLLRMIVSLATGPTKLSKEQISNLGNWLFVYLIEAASSYIPEQIGTDFHSDQIQIFRCYVQPCIFLFSGSDRLLSHVLKLFDSSIMNDNLPGLEHVLKPFKRVRTVCSILILMHDDVRLQGSLSLCNAAIKCLLQNVLILLESDNYALLLEEKHVLQTLFDQLKSRACKLQCSDATNLNM